MALDEPLAGHPLPVDGPYAAGHLPSRQRLRAGLLPALGEAEGDRAAGGLLGEGEQVLGLAAAQGVEDGCRDAVLEADLVADLVDEVVHPRHPLVVGAGESGQPQRGPLDGDRGVAGRQPHDRLAGLARERAGLADGGGIEIEHGLSWVQTLREITSGTGILRRGSPRAARSAALRTGRRRRTPSGHAPRCAAPTGRALPG